MVFFEMDLGAYWLTEHGIKWVKKKKMTLVPGEGASRGHQFFYGWTFRSCMTPSVEPAWSSSKSV